MCEGMQVDARGCVCPQPLMKMVRQMKVPGCTAFDMLVDNSTARENVCRVAESRGWRVESVSEADGGVRIALSRE